MISNNNITKDDRQRSNSPLVHDYKPNNLNNNIIPTNKNQLNIEDPKIEKTRRMASTNASNNDRQRSNSPLVSEYKPNQLNNNVNLNNKNQLINVPNITDPKIDQARRNAYTNASKDDRQRSNSPLVSEYKPNNLNNNINLNNKNQLENVSDPKIDQARRILSANPSKDDRQRSNSPLVSDYKPNNLNNNIIQQKIPQNVTKETSNTISNIQKIDQSRRLENTNIPKDDKQRSNSPMISDYKSNNLSINNKNESKINPIINNRERSNSPIVSDYKPNNLNNSQNKISNSPSFDHTNKFDQPRRNLTNNNKKDERQRSNSPLVSDYKPNNLNNSPFNKSLNEIKVFNLLNNFF